MNKQSITPEQFRAVAGTMPACRAADALGISRELLPPGTELFHQHSVCLQALEARREADRR